MKHFSIILAICLARATASGQGTIVWDETVNGPFSEDFNVPTLLGSLQIGTNTIIGSTEVVPMGPNWAGHPDLFTFQIPDNWIISAIFFQVDKPNVWTGVKDPSYTTTFGFVANPTSGELISQWGLSSIGSGNYGMFLENVNLLPITSVATYQLDFIVQAIPEPGTVSLLLLGAGFFGFHGWRKFRFKAK